MKSLLNVSAPVLVLSLLAAGCSGGTGSAAPSALAATPMQAAPAKANGSGVVMQYRVEGTPAVGQPVSVVLSFDNITAPTGAGLRISVDGSLSLAGGAPPAELRPNQVSTVTVQVVPGAEGIGYLNIFTTQNGATSAASVPVQVGKAPASMPSAGVLKSTPSGEKIISLPAK